MLTLLGLIGKLTELIVTKVANKQVDLALDEKRAAAKAFVRFHESLTQLQGVLDQFLAYTQSFAEGRNFNIRESRIASIAEQVGPASTEFLNSLKHLSPVLAIYDPALRLLMGDVSLGKSELFQNIYAFLVESTGRKSTRFDWAEPDSRNRKHLFAHTRTDEFFCSWISRFQTIKSSRRIGTSGSGSSSQAWNGHRSSNSCMTQLFQPETSSTGTSKRFTSITPRSTSWPNWTAN